MSKDLESQMRAALRPVAPSDEFSLKLAASVTSQRPASVTSRLPAALEGRRPGTRWRPLAWWSSAGLAASVVMALGVHQHLQQQRLQQSGLEARREVLEALRVTSQKLNLAYEAVKSQSTSLTDAQSGA
jgi:Lon protease-like protein